jgi:mono/diheme cytochrome c family protein
VLAVIASALLEGGAALAQSGPDSSPPAAGEAATESAETPAPEQPVQGEQVFQSACVACHGVDGRGGYGGGVPLDQVRDPALVVATVTDGRGQMPPLGELLTAEQISAVAAYIVDGLFK